MRQFGRDAPAQEVLSTVNPLPAPPCNSTVPRASLAPHGTVSKAIKAMSFGHGGVVGVSNATRLREACDAVNRFLKNRFPRDYWTN